MYCPSCGSDADERQPSQYCRACGFDLRGVRQTLERPDSITDSAISARQQISLAIAEKIKEVETGDDLKEIVEEVLPQIEKFLESPEERRLRRIRAGLITGSIGFGASLGALFMTITDADRMLVPSESPMLNSPRSVVCRADALRMNRNRAPNPQACWYMALARRTPLIPAENPG